MLAVGAGSRIVSVTLGVFLGGIGGGIVYPILPLLGLQLGLAPSLIGLILAANRVARIGTNAFAGVAIDRYGGKRPLLLGLLIEAAATTGYWFGLRGHAAGVWFLLSRTLWGVGSAAVFVGALTLALNASRQEDRGSAAGLVRSALSLGMPAGLVVGGVIAGAWGDGPAFLCASLASLIACLVGLRTFPDPQPGDPAGRSWRDFWGEVLRGLRDRRILALGGMNFLGFFALQGVLLSTLVLLVAGRRLSLLGLPAEPTSGLLLATLLGTSAVTAVWSGRVSDRVANRARVTVPAVLAVAGGLVLVGAARTAPELAGALALAGLGMGGFNAPLVALIGDVVPPAQRGSAVGVYQLCGDVGGSLGPVLGVDLVVLGGFTLPYLAVAAFVCLGLPLLAYLGRATAEKGRDAGATAPSRP